MSRYIRYIASLISGGIAFALLSSVASAAPFFTPSAGETLASKMSVRGEISTNASQTWGGKLITDFDTVNTPITPSTPSQELYFDNNTQTFSGFLILTALCMTSDCKDPSDTSKWDQSAFVSFAHGVSGQEVRLENNGGDIYTLSGFAWSPSVGWIAFGVGADPVRYDRNTGNFSGYAWSDIIGYIKFSGLKMASKAPVLTGSDIQVANHDATITVSGATAAEGGYSEYQLSLVDFSGPNPSSSIGLFAGIDLREAKDYGYTLNDPYGNYRTGNLRVVAGAPSTTLHTSHITGVTQATYASTGGTTPADGTSTQEVSVFIRDTYGNPVISQSGIKTVTYSLQFQNNISPSPAPLDISTKLLDVNAIADTTSNGLSVEFSHSGGEDFATNIDLQRIAIVNASTYTRSVESLSGFTSLKIRSWLPTTPGALALNSVSVRVVRDTSLGTSVFVGQQGNTLIAGLSTNIDFSAPWQGSFSLSGTTTDDVFGLNIPFKTNTTYTASGANPTGSTHHLYKFSSGVDLINFLTLSGASATMIGDYYYTGDKTIDTGFELLPRLGASTLTGFTFNIEHTALRVVTRNDSGTLYYLAYPIGTSTANATANRGVKILGTAGGASDSFFALSQAESYTRAGDFRKPQVRDLIRQNVEEIKRKTPSNVLVKSGNYTMLPADMTSQAIIVTGGNFTIDQDNFGSGSSSPKAIIVLGGDVIIKSNVQNIYASIYTDHGIRNDGVDSSQQLYIYGTVISGNTIGTSASTTSTACPDFLTTTDCTDIAKKRIYDLNFLRIGPSNTGHASGLGGRHTEYPLVIEYDPRLTTDLPPGFRKVTR